MATNNLQLAALACLGFCFGQYCDHTAFASVLSSCQEFNDHRLSEKDNVDDTNKQNEKIGVGERNYWQSRNGAEILRELRRQPNKNVAKNVVFLMGDGYSTIDTTVARIFKDQVYGVKPAGHRPLVYETFEYNGELRTLSCDNWATDSAAAITAYTSGGKANEETLNVNCNAKLASCTAELESNRYTIITDLLKQAGKAVGVVTTTIFSAECTHSTNSTITHASPAGFYAHSTQREWESDADQPAEKRLCEKDIARQLIEDAPGRDIDVLLGGGWSSFIPPNDTTGFLEGVAGGRRQDKRNLLQTWLSNHQTTGPSLVVTNRTALLEVDASKTDFLLGLFNPSHLEYQLDRVKGNVAPQKITPEQIQKLEFNEPTLLEMTQKALEILQAKAKKTGDGYFLFVEGGKIDFAHHDSKFAKALHETLEWERAVKWVFDHTNKNDTLIIVSSDHAHSSFFIGHAEQTESILGESKALYEVAQPAFSSLGYASGPGGMFGNQGKRPPYNATSDPLADKDYVYQAAVYMEVASHGGQDVPVFANGPWAHLLNGAHDNTYLFDVMAFAACLPVPAATAEAKFGEVERGQNSTDRDAENQSQTGSSLKLLRPAQRQYGNDTSTKNSLERNYLPPAGPHCAGVRTRRV